MAKPVKDGKLLYHLTALNNLEGIFSKGLLPRSQVVPSIDVAAREIIDKRKKLKINNYVPFHFFCKNPFDGSVQKNYEQHFIYITVKRDHAKKVGAKIIPRHPLSMEKLEIYEYEEGIEKINWVVLEKRDYADNECKEICMCEVVFLEKIEITNFHAITVKNKEDKATVDTLINKLKEKKKSI